MKKRNLLMLFGLVIVLGFSLIGGIYALLKDKKTQGPVTFSFGELKFSFNGELKQSYLYPGENLVVDEFVLNNESSIDVEIRIVLSFYIDDVLIDINDIAEVFDLSLQEWLAGTDLDYGSYYQYYKTITPTDEVITLFTDLTLDGMVVKNNYSNKKLKIKLAVYAKQKEHATWEALGQNFIGE